MRTDVALMTLRSLRNKLTKQQYKTIKGQIFAGDVDGAMKGLAKIAAKSGGSQ